ncbi:MAG: type II restriction endonuclease [Synergistaceae bacterium]|nr:type II restriction endonuclease [Synergistaceae bacterium]
MRGRNFEEWFSTFRESINGYDYYVDFIKARRNVSKVQDELHILNMLVNTKNDIEAEFVRIIRKYPECLKAVPILLAIRSYEIYCQDENTALTYRFDKAVQTPEQYVYFMRETGMFDMLREGIYHDLRDYVSGVEVGLDSNGRKNRGGHQMERFVESFLKESGATYSREITTRKLSKQYGLAFPPDFAPNKRWDFAVKTPGHVCAIETNFYTDGGSKLNETARSYRLIAEQSRDIPGFTFIWITDGKGWLSAKTDLHETFSVLDDLYNIADLEAGLFTRIFPR